MKENRSIILKVRVKPGASRNEVRQLDESSYEVRTTQVPEKGKANEKVLELLAEHLHLPKSKLELVRGHTSKFKEIKTEFS